MPSQKSSGKVPANAVSKLADAITNRRVGQAKKMFDKHGDQIASLAPSYESAADLLYAAATWIDFDYSYLPLVERAIAAFRQVPCESLTVRDAALVDAVEGIVMLHGEEFELAIKHFGHVVDITDRHKINNLRTDVYYHLARCYWKKGRYLTALDYVRKFKEMNANLGRPKLTAAGEMVEAWLYFLLGKFQEAEAVLKHAESEMADTDNYYERGNIASFWGRLARRKGDLDLAIEHFYQSISEYSQYGKLFKNTKTHRNAGRSHTNIAVVLMLKARNLEDRPQKDSQQKIQQLRQEAFEHLAEAERIYLTDPKRNHRELAKVYNNRAWFYITQESFDLAKKEAKQAYELGKEKSDHLVMGNTRITQSKIALSGGSRNVRLALDLAREAIRQARQTDNWRLQARAYIWLGEVLLEPPFQYYTRSCAYRDQAKKLLEATDGRDYLHEDLESLQGLIDHASFDETVVIYLERGEILMRPLKETLKNVGNKIIRYVHQDSELGNEKNDKTAKLLKTAPKRVREALNGDALP